MGVRMAWKSVKIQGISTENMAYGPQKYGIRTPLFRPREPFLLGVGVVFNLLSFTLSRMEKIASRRGQKIGAR